MIRIALIGEDPYDKISLKNLLSRKYNQITFCPILRGIKGHALDSPKVKRSLVVELSETKYHLVIFIRDLDGLPSQKHLLFKYEVWFKSLQISSSDILLLNIWELETLIFSDIETFNKEYKTNIKANRDPMMISNPKEELKHYTNRGRKKYHESDCPAIFNLLNIENIIKECRYFRDFIIDLEKKIEIL